VFAEAEGQDAKWDNKPFHLTRGARFFLKFSVESKSIAFSQAYLAPRSGELNVKAFF
jgi:hypothetical protein